MAKILAFAIFIGCASLSYADILFIFDGNPINEQTPFTDTLNGLSATFSGPGAVCDVSGLYVSLSGNALTQDFCQSTGSGALKVAFSQNV